MIKKIAEVMLYVDNQEKFGFTVVSDEDNGEGLRLGKGLILHNKKIIAKIAARVKFYTEDIDHLYKDYQDKQITVGELVTMPFGKVFNFADNEYYYFAFKKSEHNDHSLG